MTCLPSGATNCTSVLRGSLLDACCVTNLAQVCGTSMENWAPLIPLAFVASAVWGTSAGNEAGFGADADCRGCSGGRMDCPPTVLASANPPPAAARKSSIATIASTNLANVPRPAGSGGPAGGVGTAGGLMKGSGPGGGGHSGLASAVGV